MDYKSMKLDELVEYINLQLEKKRTFLEIATEDFSCNESTLRKRLTGKKLYKRIGNKYLRQSQTLDDESKHINDVRQNVTNENISQSISETVSQSVTVFQNNNEKFLGLINNYELIMQMLEEYKKYKNINKFSCLTVELPQEQEKDFRITLRLNDVVYKEELDYIMGNPPFVGYSLQTQIQKEDIQHDWFPSRDRVHRGRCADDRGHLQV